MIIIKKWCSFFLGSYTIFLYLYLFYSFIRSFLIILLYRGIA